MDVALVLSRTHLIADVERIEVARERMRRRQSQLIGGVKLRHNPTAWMAGHSELQD
jgi:hypothetical protein